MRALKEWRKKKDNRFYCLSEHHVGERLTHDMIVNGQCYCAPCYRIYLAQLPSRQKKRQPRQKVERLKQKKKEKRSSHVRRSHTRRISKN